MKVKLAQLKEKMVVGPLLLKGDRTYGTDEHRRQGVELSWSDDGLVVKKGAVQVLIPRHNVDFVQFEGK